MKRLSMSIVLLTTISASVWIGMVDSRPAVAQSGSRGGTGSQPQRMQQRPAAQRPTPRGSTSPEPMSFEQKFWNHLQHHSYQDWAPAPSGSGDFMEGQSPHGAFVKLFLNRTAAGNPQNLPHGSIIVKENYGPDRESLMAVTVMYRTEGYNPEGGDWYWVKCNPDGSVATMPPEMGSMRIAGKVNACIECHAGSNGNDFSFVND